MIQKVETIAKIELLGLPLTADARERRAEYAEVTAISSDSEVHFVSLSSAMAADDNKPFCVGDCDRGSSLRLSKKRALKRTHKAKYAAKAAQAADKC